MLHKFISNTAIETNFRHRHSQSNHEQSQVCHVLLIGIIVASIIRNFTINAIARCENESRDCCREGRKPHKVWQQFIMHRRNV